MECNKCHITKPLSSYYGDSNNKSGKQKTCKPCKAHIKKQFYRTKEGLLSRIFDNQKTTAKKWQYDPPDYTLAELREWALAQRIFYKLYGKWVASGYEINFIPSCDRIDDYRSYTLDNLQLMTWRENLEKAHNDLAN